MATARPEGTRRLAVAVDGPRNEFLHAKRISPSAWPRCHRLPDEADMKFRQTTGADRGCQVRVQLSSAYRIEKDLRLPRKGRSVANAAARSAADVCRARSCRPRGGARAAAGRDFEQVLRRDPSLARACAGPWSVGPRLARHRWPGRGGRLSPGRRTVAHGSVRLHRDGRSAVTIAGTSLDDVSTTSAWPIRLRACPRHPGRRKRCGLAEGLQNALSALGGVPLQDCSDSCRPLPQLGQETQDDLT